MLSNLSNKIKLNWLFVISGIFILLCYQFALKKTISDYYENSQMHETIDSAKNYTGSPVEFSRNEIQANKLFKNLQADKLRTPNSILNSISETCIKNSSNIKEFKPFIMTNRDSLHILTVMVVIEGTFSSILEVIYDLETRKTVGRISSVDFKKYTDPLDKKEKLGCTFYIQNILLMNENDEK